MNFVYLPGCFVLFLSQFQREKRKRFLGPYPAFSAVGLFVPLAERRVTVSALVDKVFDLGRFGFKRILLATVGIVAIKPDFISVHQVA